MPPEAERRAFRSHFLRFLSTNPIGIRCPESSGLPSYPDMTPRQSTHKTPGHSPTHSTSAQPCDHPASGRAVLPKQTRRAF